MAILEQKKKALVISLTLLTSEPRVIRQIHLLLKNEYKVYVAGFLGGGALSDLLKKCTIIEILAKRQSSKWDTLLYLFFSSLFSFKERAMEVFYGRTHRYQEVFEYLKNNPVNLVLCHDYYAAPIGFALSQRFRCPYMVDVHEHALTQHQVQKGFLKKIKWKFQKLYVHQIQKKYFPQAHALTTVSDGIADSLQQDYALSSRPTVVRSVPFYQTSPFRPLHPQNPIKLLYHGGFSPHRGLEECIQAMALCDERFSLTLRGNGDPAYEHMLRQLADQSPAKERIHFEPLVPFHEIIPKASLSDIGLFIPPEVSLQRTYTLPNKFFEYIMAGLALAVAHLPEMARIVKTYDLGILIPAASPQEIARALNALTHEKINYYKQQALLAAKDLCWDKEVEKLGILCDERKVAS